MGQQKSSIGAAAAVLLLLVTTAVADDPQGPAFGANRYNASIHRVCSQPDVDDYVGSLLAGEKLSATVTVPKTSTLSPLLTLVSSDGTEIVPPVVVRNGGKSVSLKAFSVPSTGKWAVRVAAANDTEGAYTIAFAVAAAPKAKAAPVTFVGDTAVVPFDGIDGAALDLKITWKGDAQPLTLDAVEDPQHVSVPGLAPVAGKNSITVNALPLRTGDGRYGLRISRHGGTPVVTYLLKVTPRGRPVSRSAVALSDDEPWVASTGTPIRCVSGLRLHLAGGNFSREAPPKVKFGSAAAIATVSTGGDALDVIAPELPDGSLVGISVIGADGQACQRDDFAYYVPPPTVTDLVDSHGGSVRLGRAAGGDSLSLRGTSLEAKQTVRFGTAIAQVVARTTSVQLEIVTPATTGSVKVSVADEFGRKIESTWRFDFKEPPRFAAAPYSPAFGALAGGTLVTVTGSGFEATDRLLVDGSPATVTYVNPTTIRFVSPVLGAGDHAIAVLDRFDGRRDAPAFEAKPAPVVDSVLAVGGAILDESHIASGGSAEIAISGDHFRSGATVTLGGLPVTVLSASDESIHFIAPPGALGSADLVVTDSVGQSVTLRNAIRFVGWGDATAKHSPGTGARDDLSAHRGFLGDFDQDGDSGDLVIVSNDASVGSRTGFTRLLAIGYDEAADQTDTAFPVPFNDPAGLDDWKAGAVALGDLDAAGYSDIVIGGPHVSNGAGGAFEARLFDNDGTGKFTFDEMSPVVRTDAWIAYDTSYLYFGSFNLFEPAVPATGSVTAMAVGDLDGDGDDDLVLGTDHFRTGTLHVPLVNVSFSGDQAYANYAYYFNWTGTQIESPALRIFDNERAWGGELTDRTFTRLPRDDQPGSGMPAFHSRDLKLADIDGDGDLDIVLTWDDPSTVTPAGMSNPGSVAPMIATRVLENDGTGFFTDVTDAWMPAASGNEYWQANRLMLTDLDGDGDLDLVLVHRDSIDAYTGSTTYAERALRVLRNDGSSFVDVTASVLPSVPLAGTKDDNLRGAAVAVVDFDGDGSLDLVVSTTESLADDASGRARSTRLLRGGAGFTFTDASAFLPATSKDTGEADDILVGDLSGSGVSSIVLLSEVKPSKSLNGENLRVFDWKE